MNIKITECPRDAMQGIKEFIPTKLKIEYLNLLLECGFDRLDFGSFVSEKAIPQMKDTKELVSKLNLTSSSTKLLAIIANTRGAKDASEFQEISYLGFPFSISETFQLRNTNSTIEESFKNVEEIQSICSKTGHLLLIYISMGFGNPYGDPWNTEIIEEWINKISSIGVTHFSIADTVGVSTPENIKYIFKFLNKQFPTLEIGAHLHSNPAISNEKILSALNSGVDYFDSAIKGYGGCPMADDHLVGNIATETLLANIKDNNLNTNLNYSKFEEAMLFSNNIFNKYF